MLILHCPSGLFNNTIANLSEKYYDQVTPEPIAFGIAWGFIYTWNFVGSVYLLVSLTLPEEDSPVNIKPTLAPKVRPDRMLLQTIAA